MGSQLLAGFCSCLVEMLLIRTSALSLFLLGAELEVCGKSELSSREQIHPATSSA